jgi:hypothetical protein
VEEIGRIKGDGAGGEGGGKRGGGEGKETRDQMVGKEETDQHVPVHLMSIRIGMNVPSNRGIVYEQMCKSIKPLLNITRIQVRRIMEREGNVGGFIRNRGEEALMRIPEGMHQGSLFENGIGT